MLSPGLGHVYLREWLRAVLWFGLILTSTTILVPASPEPAEFTLEAIFQASLAAAESLPLRNQIALFTLTSISMADAYWIATQGNRNAAAAEGVRCPACGKEVDEDLEFCHWCTTELVYEE